MTLHEIAESIIRKLTPAHLQLLEVCFNYPKGESGGFCGEWIMHACERQGVPFHQGWLTKLANVGLLMKDDSSRAGRRRYYHIESAELVRDVLDQAVQNGLVGG
jgi:hypothetical protein